MSSLLEKSANIFLIVACTVVVGEYGYRHVHKSSQKRGVFSSGEHIEGTASLALTSAPRTLIIAMSSNCPYCKASMPAYKQIADAARKVGTRVVAVSGEASEVNQAYLVSHGIVVERVLSQAESGVHVPQVPSLILVRGDGTVVDSWTGLADGAFERSAMKAVTNN
jgi:hypothetical protein